MTGRPFRVSFDLDDTLICPTPTPAEPRSRWRRWRHPEPLRLGAVSLFRTLPARGDSLTIYTTSYRSPRSIRGWLHSHGLAVDEVINQDGHDRIVGRSGPSKFPPAFAIDLHVDDLPGVAQEGQRYGFATLIIDRADPLWAQRVLDHLDGWPGRSPR